MNRLQINNRLNQTGVYALEFVLVATFMFLVLFSIIELGKVLYFFDTASEATRTAARLGTVCSQNNAAIKAAITNRLPFTTASNVLISYNPISCTSDTCKTITVSLTGATYNSAIFGFNVQMPSFATTLPRESMDSQYNSNCS